MSKKLFLISLATTVALPVIVAPVKAQEVSTEASQDFKDVPKSHSAYREIMTMRDQGIINGYPDNTFRPAQSISRVHTASLFVRSLDLKPVRNGKEFKDVPKSNEYYNAVQTVYRAGIFDGKSDGTFGINDKLTRAQMAKVLVNAFELEIQPGYIFTDIGADNWAKDYISTLYMNGITTGSNGEYMPSKAVSRAHYSAFLFRALYPEQAPTPEKPLEPNPVPKPEPPKSDPKPETQITGNPFPKAEDVKQPAGWTEEKMKENAVIMEYAVFERSPKRGSGTSFGTTHYLLSDFDDPAFLKMVENRLKGNNGTMTINEYVADVNEALKTGKPVIARDYTYGVYAEYGTVTKTETVIINGVPTVITKHVPFVSIETFM